MTEIRSVDLTRTRAREIAEASHTLSDGFPVGSGSDGLFRGAPFLTIPDLHEYLTDAADWDAETWDFEAEGCVRLARTLEWLYTRLPEAFQFSSTWNPASVEEREIDRAELLAVVARNEVSTSTIYTVRAV